MIKPSLVFLSLVCASAAAGGALQQFFLSAPVRESGGATAVDNGAVAQLGVIAEELRGIRSRLDAQSTTPLTREAAAPGVTAPVSIKDLTAALERLRIVIDNANVKFGAAPAPLLVTRKTIVPFEILELAKSLKDLPEKECQRKFMFLPTQELLHRYGPPTSLDIIPGSQAWDYTTSENIVDGQTWATVTFRVVDGFVFDVSIRYVE